MTSRQSISISILRSIAISLLLLTLVPTAQAQSSSRRKAEMEKLRQKQIDDSIPWLQGFQVTTDLVGPIQRAVGSYGQVEAALRVNLKDKYFPIVELGYGDADETDDVTDIQYKSSAPYGRIGVDFNMLKDKHDIYRLYGGLRYALSYFKYSIKHDDIHDPVWGGNAPYQLDDVKANYHWAEVVVGIDAKIYGPLHMGWSLRYKRRLIHDEGDDYNNVWYVPGFGKRGDTRLGGTFNIGIEF